MVKIAAQCTRDIAHERVGAHFGRMRLAQSLPPMRIASSRSQPIHRIAPAPSQVSTPLLSRCVLTPRDRSSVSLCWLTCPAPPRRGRTPPSGSTTQALLPLCVAAIPDVAGMRRWAPGAMRWTTSSPESSSAYKRTAWRDVIRSHRAATVHPSVTTAVNASFFPCSQSSYCNTMVVPGACR